MTKIIAVEGIGAVYAKKLLEAGVATIEALLEMGASPQGRKLLAEKTGISDKLLLQWINHADLFRIRGIATQYSDLLEAAGVDTVPELAMRVPENLFKKLVEINQQSRCVRRTPTLAQVQSWVEQAKKLPRIVNY